MLEPRSATAGASSRASAHTDSTSSTAPGPNAPSERPCPRASKAIAASPCARHRRPKSKWLSFAEPAPWQITTAAVGGSSGSNSA